MIDIIVTTTVTMIEIITINNNTTRIDMIISTTTAIGMVTIVITS